MGMDSMTVTARGHYMRRLSGSQATPILLPAIDGTQFDSNTLQGKPYMLSFFRFASCPFCNLRIHELVKRFGEFQQPFTIVAIFDSPLDNLIEHAAGHHAPFPILADSNGDYYQTYSIEKSLVGVMKGMLTRMPTLIKGMSKGYVPTKIKGSMTTMPADFLIDTNGIIQLAYYGNDEGGHLDINTVKAFSQGIPLSASQANQHEQAG
jgi:peroxiredoxin